MRQATIDRINEDVIRHRHQRRWAWRIFGGLVIMMTLGVAGSLIGPKCGGFFLAIGALAFISLVGPMFGRSP